MVEKSIRPIIASQWYEQNASKTAKKYERFSFEEVHAELIKHLPKKACAVLDVGAGTGRDAAGLARLGHSVTAVEPCSKLREIARKNHHASNIDWIDDSLPKLNKVRKAGLSYDVILLSAVWMHVTQSERSAAFRRLVSMLNPNGLLCITLRHGPFEPVQGFWDIPDEQVRAYARDFGLFEVECSKEADKLGRPGVYWTRLVFRTPGDGTGALPLLRGIILNDRKTATYKLGLLRTLIRISQSAGGLAQVHDKHVVLPLGLFALYWLRLYRPLLDENLPQLSTNTQGTDGVGFAREAYHRLDSVSTLDIRVGAVFSDDNLKNLHRALKEICNSLVNFPMHFTTYPGTKNQVFVAQSLRNRSAFNGVISTDYLRSFGSVTIPLGVWQAAQNYGAWIEPAIISEWKSLMRRFAKSQGDRQLNFEAMEEALVWSDPTRSTVYPRQRAKQLIENNVFNHCIWSGKRINTKNVDIDHCFPFSAWPCEDMWNLMPSKRSINQYQKRDKLPSREILHQARERILDWWDVAYMDSLQRTSQSVLQ